MTDNEKKEKTFKGDREKVIGSIKNIFEFLGEEVGREGLKETPTRMVRSWERIFGGYLQDVNEIITTFVEDDVVHKGQIILLKDIEFYSTCEHHFLPFIGKAHVAYMPVNKVVGVSKLARILEVYSRRLQIQERVGHQVTEAVMKGLDAEAAACIIEAKHFCMACRGVEKQNSVMVTTSLKGKFQTDSLCRQELLGLIS